MVVDRGVAVEVEMAMIMGHRGDLISPTKRRTRKPRSLRNRRNLRAGAAPTAMTMMTVLGPAMAPVSLLRTKTRRRIAIIR